MTRTEAKKLVLEDPKLAAEIIVAATKLRQALLAGRTDKTTECLDVLGARLSFSNKS